MDITNIANYQNKVSFTKTKNLERLKMECDKFEAEILRFFLKEAMDSKNELFPKTPGEKIYKSMYQETLADKMSGNFGYSELLFNYLKDKI
ncbi:hypothetical protein FE773_02680 [Caminibacter mediatlanticus TB-2]|nr:rod-binding protein [Caminibacter mediatlanticus]QCT94117.1 hypothetical protein FE773_02680 [Caminibacter mediatlanticus TB-2]